MAYSLTSASALGLDLVRTPGGAAVAGVLLQGLALDPAALPVAPPPAAHLAAARAAAFTLLGERPAVPAVDLRAAETVDEPVDGRHGDGNDTATVRPATVEEAAETLTAALRRLRRRAGAVSLGTVEDLLALARSLPVDAYGRAGGPRVDGLVLRPAAASRLGAVLADAVLAELVRGSEHPDGAEVARSLLAPAHGTRLLPPLREPGAEVTVPAAAALLRRVAGATLAELCTPDRLQPSVWAHHVHVASWAVELTGRTRLAATAQLELVRALAAAGVDGDLAAAGVWNTCSGAVHALVVGDVLPDDSHQVLAADLLDALQAAGS